MPADSSACALVSPISSRRFCIHPPSIMSAIVESSPTAREHDQSTTPPRTVSGRTRQANAGSFSTIGAPCGRWSARYSTTILTPPTHRDRTTGRPTRKESRASPSGRPSSAKAFAWPITSRYVLTHRPPRLTRVSRTTLPNVFSPNSFTFEILDSCAGRGLENAPRPPAALPLARFTIEQSPIENVAASNRQRPLERAEMADDADGPHFTNALLRNTHRGREPLNGLVMLSHQKHNSRPVHMLHTRSISTCG